MLRQPAVTGGLADGPSGWRGHKSGPPGWWGHESGPLGWWAREGSTGSDGPEGGRSARLPITCRNREPSSMSLARIRATPTWVVATAAAVVWLVSGRLHGSLRSALVPRPPGLPVGGPCASSTTDDPFLRYLLPRTTCRSRTPHLPSLLSVRSRSVGVIEALWWLASSAALVFTLYRVMICTGGTPQNPGAAPATLSAPATAAPGPGEEAPARHAVIPNGRGERTSTQDSWSFSPSAIAYRSLIVTITLRNPGARVGLDSEHRIDLDL